MAYTEIKKRNGKSYYYRVVSVRNKDKVSKKRIYLGVDLCKKELHNKEKEADEQFLAVRKKEAIKHLQKLIPKIKYILKKHNVKKAGIFGSYVRGDQTKNSDIDIIIEPPKGIGFGFYGIANQLEEELDKKVDLITYKYMSPYLKDEILKSEVRIL